MVDYLFGFCYHNLLPTQAATPLILTMTCNLIRNAPPDVLRAQIDELERLMADKEERIKEKDAQIKEKDAQIGRLMGIIERMGDQK